MNVLVKFFFDGVLGSEWRWFRFKYHGRGGIHLHGTVKLENDPGLVELTATAYEGVCAEVVYTQRRNEVLGILGDVGAVVLPEGIDAELQQLKEVISTGLAAEDTIYRYADWLVSTTNTRTSAERGPVVFPILTLPPSNPYGGVLLKMNPLPLTTSTALLTVYNGTSALWRGTAREKS